jgi:hypothetical protein
VILPEMGNKFLLWSNKARNIPIKNEELNSLEVAKQP